MTDFIVNESKFIVDMDEHRGQYLLAGTVLPSNDVVDEMMDDGENYQIYITKDGKKQILAVNKQIAKQWVQAKLIPEHALFSINEHDDFVILFSPISLIVVTCTNAKAYGSQRYALSFASAILRTRECFVQENLRDGIFFELYGCILPIFSKSRAVADRIVFENILRAVHQETIESKDEIKDPGLNEFTIKSILSKYNMPLPCIEPYLYIGESIDQYVDIGKNLNVSSYVLLNENYQIYNTNSDQYLLLLDRNYAQKLIENNLLEQMEMLSIQVDGRMLVAMILSKEYALEPLNLRHFGQSEFNCLKLAINISKFRSKFANVDISNALYIEQLNLIIPDNFEQNSRISDSSLIKEIATCGPFALSPFSQELIDACVKIVA